HSRHRGPRQAPPRKRRLEQKFYPRTWGAGAGPPLNLFPQMPTAVNVTTDWCAPAGTPNPTGPTTIENGQASPAAGGNVLLVPRLRFGPLVGIGAEAPLKGARNACGADTGPDEIDIGMSVGEKNGVRVTVSW